MIESLGIGTLFAGFLIIGGMAVGGFLQALKTKAFADLYFHALGIGIVAFACGALLLYHWLI